MTDDSFGYRVGNTQWIERDSTRINIESVLPRLPRDIDDMSLGLPRLQPLQRFLNRTKSSNERVLVRRPSPRLRYLSCTIRIHTSAITNESIPRLAISYSVNGEKWKGEEEREKRKRTTYRIFSDLTYIPRRQILPTSLSPQVRMTCRPIMSGDSDRFSILRW